MKNERFPETHGQKLNTKLNIRISSRDFEEMKKNIELLNSNSDFEINVQGFVRLSIRILNKKIANEGLSISFKP